jgi:hypothetical protein
MRNTTIYHAVYTAMNHESLIHTMYHMMHYIIFSLCYFKAYIISTPKREVCNHTGPPDNTNHVREWTFTEMQLYLESEGFVIIKSFNGIASVYCGQHVGYFN